MLVSTMIAALGYFTTDITANGLVIATINGQIYTSSLPTNWSLAIENGNETRIGGSGAASRKANEAGELKIGGSGDITVGYSIVDSRTINSSDKIVFSYTKNQFASCSLNNYTTTVESASSGICGEAFEVSAQIGSGQQEHETTLPAHLSIVTTGSQWYDVTGGKRCDFQMTTYHVYSARAQNNLANPGTNTVCVAQGDTGLRVIPGTVKILSNGYLTLNVPTFLKNVTFQVNQGQDVLLDSGQENLVSGTVTVPMDEMASGSYDIYVKATRSLRRKMSIQYTAGSVPIFRPLTLYFGDINGDNTITQEEVDFVNAQIGKTNATSTWYEDCGNVHHWVPAQADMNGDGQVTTADYNLVSGNVGRVGN